MFRQFADRTALKKIASMLNEEGIPAPNDGGRGNKRGHGWGHTTIRAMLSNERYIAQWKGRLLPSSTAAASHISPGQKAIVILDELRDRAALNLLDPWS